MGDLTITHDGTTGELLAHIAELQRKATAYDELRRELAEAKKVIEEVADLATAQEKRTEELGHEWSNGYYGGKASAYTLAAGWIEELL